MFLITQVTSTDNWPVWLQFSNDINTKTTLKTGISKQERGIKNFYNKRPFYYINDPEAIDYDIQSAVNFQAL